MLLRRIISIRSFSLNSFVQNRVNTNNMLKLATTRFYSQARLSKEEIESRIIDIVKGFDKITDPSKITPTSSFSADLGLDSLDTVEVVMAIEEAFNIEIPDKEADEIKTIGEAITYISNHPDGISSIFIHFYDIYLRGCSMLNLARNYTVRPDSRP